MEKKKREWTKPKLLVFGTIEKITGGPEPQLKKKGTGDDLDNLISSV